MSNIYKTNFDNIKEVYKNIFDALERALKKFDIDFYLIGAQSRDVWINHLDLYARATRDIDFSVFIKDHEKWNQLTAFLISEEGFARDKKEPYRFYSGAIVDLIPFGGIEENGEVRLDNPATELSVYGCKEVTEEAVVLEGGFKVITLPGLCIMKLIAWNERPDRRAKDWEDFLFILTNYHEIAGEQLFEGNHDDLFDDNFELPIAAARMLGRNMRSVLNKNQKLKTKVVDILLHHLKGYGYEQINDMYRVRESDDRIILHLKLISETVKGINDTD